MICKTVFSSEFLDIPDNAGKVTRRRRRRTQVIEKCYKFHANATRSLGTTSVCFFVVTVNDEHSKRRFKIKRRG